MRNAAGQSGFFACRRPGLAKAANAVSVLVKEPRDDLASFSLQRPRLFELSFAHFAQLRRQREVATLSALGFARFESQPSGLHVHVLFLAGQDS